MIKYIFLIFPFLFYSQQVKVEYLNIRSAIANVKEYLYLKENNAISIQDSIVSFKYPNDISAKTKNVGFSNHYISNNINSDENRFFHFMEVIGNDSEHFYLVKDNVPKINWTIDYKNTKTLLGYKCFKAEGEFRGRNYEAYFTPDLKFDAGPYKFYGLPGLILEIKAKNLFFFWWKATSVETNNKEVVKFVPLYKNYNELENKDFISLKDADRAKFSKQIADIRMPGVIRQEIKERPGIEAIFEWEK